MKEEEWLPITGLEGYEVSNLGRVRSPKKILKLYTRNKYGHQRIGIKNRRYEVHRLVLETFSGPCPEGMECMHLNGIADDNRVENLRWGTRSENAKMAYDDHNRVHNWIGAKHNDETKRLMSVAAKKRPNNWLGRKHTPETKRRMSIAAKKRGNNR